MSALHPVIAETLAAFVPPAPAPSREALRQRRARLEKLHDQQLEVLEAISRELDELDEQLDGEQVR